jgi:hypothetical protein
MLKDKISTVVSTGIRIPLVIMGAGVLVAVPLAMLYLAVKVVRMAWGG